VGSRDRSRQVLLLVVCGLLAAAIVVFVTQRERAAASDLPSPSPSASVIGVSPAPSPSATQAASSATPTPHPTGSPSARPQPRAKPKRLRTSAQVQRRLVALRYLPASAVTGVDDYRTQQAVMAFQAWEGLQRDGIAGPHTKARLLKAGPPKPRNEHLKGRYAEVYRSLGVLLLVEHGVVVRAVHCSTGMPGLETPAGRFAVYFKALSWWSTIYQVLMPYASFFTGGDAIHGLYPVPAYPASHGCVRVSMPEAPWVYSFLRLGTPVFVF